MKILSLLKKPTYSIVFLGLAVLVFDVAYYIMATFPGEKDLMCMTGANLTPWNIAFSAIFSIVVALLIVGMIHLGSMRFKEKRIGSVTALSGMGMIFGVLTMFCTFCTLPLISVFGFTIGFGVFTFYEVYFQIASVFLLGFAYWQLERQLNKGCACEIKTPKK